jgi:alanyl-tRNA synthetase
MKSIDIRQRFFNFFNAKKHESVTSSSLIPAQDPTLLFTNAGMNQFKDLFLGLEKRDYTRAVSIQKCVRAGGKHNDLDNVGFTKRHLTFFEMMGNFSFGDYFKREAIEYAWEFLTKQIGLPEEKLHATVFETDDEAYGIWHKTIGLPKERIHRLGAETNFWQMGDLGPCGPCTEIFIDRGTAYGASTDTPASDSERFLEIWNLVFMQYDRQLDGHLKPLKQTGVDTGMGLERLCLVTQNKDSVFQTDLFAAIITRTEELTKKQYVQQTDQLKAAFHVLADHIRSSSLLIADGCVPANEGRGYVLRKIIRRAALFAQKLSTENIFPELSKIVIADLGGIYKELVANQKIIYATLMSETEKFSTNLSRGSILLEQLFTKNSTKKHISGSDAFKLYDTYGFPVELVVAEARERGYTVDTAAFEEEMTRQKEQSGQKTTDILAHLELDESISSEFTGYQELETESKIIALVQNNQLVSSVTKGSECYVIARKSPFFIVGGGQVPDHGWLVHNEVQTPITEVRYIQHAIAAKIVAPANMKIDDVIVSKVDPVWRTNAMKNHTATHLLQAALMQRFGKQIKQAGSLVHPDYLRFDFSYPDNLTSDDIKKIEQSVNNIIMQNIPVTTEFMSLKEATNRGALAFFGDKYKPERVRMVQVSDFSVELCGGTHVHATGEIGVFKITEVAALAAGYRRIVALTGPGAENLFAQTYGTIKQLSVDFKVKTNEVQEAVNKQKLEIKTLQNMVKTYKQRFIQASLDNWIQGATVVGKVPFLYLALHDMENADLFEVVSHCMQKKSGMYMAVNQQENGSISFVAGLDPLLTQSVTPQLFATWLKETYGLRCGVQKNNIQGGGNSCPGQFQEEIIAWLHNLQK